MTDYATTAEINAYATQVADELPSFIVSPNSYGVRIECRACHASSRKPEWAHAHNCY